jgi:hypothetical protein
MHELENQTWTASNGGSTSKAPRKSVEDVSEDHADGAEKRSRKSGGGDIELPPNENLRKNADEAYGDTEIPERKNDV